MEELEFLRSEVKRLQHMVDRRCAPCYHCPKCGQCFGGAPPGALNPDPRGPEEEWHKCLIAMGLPALIFYLGFILVEKLTQ